jgi:hypothetical protein
VLQSEPESLYGWQSASQSVSLGVEPTLWTFDHILLPFQEFGSVIVVLSLWGSLSDERPGLQFAVRVTLRLTVSQSVSMSWCRAHFVDVWPHIASFSRVWVCNCCLISVGLPLWREAGFAVCSQSHFTADSQSVGQYVLVSCLRCGRLTRYCFLFKSFDLEFVVLFLWGALSDERSSLFFLSHSWSVVLVVSTLVPHSYLQ